MTNNQNTQNIIPATEIWEQIKALHAQLASLTESTDRIFAVSDTDEFDSGEQIATVNADVALAKIEAIKHAFSQREQTLQSLLAFYVAAYRDAAGKSES